MNTTARIERLRQALGENEIDAMLVSSAENRRYLSGFTGSAGYLLISEEGQVLVTDFRYTEQAERQSPGYRVERMTAGQGWKWLPELATDTGVSRIGFEASDVSVAVHSAFRKAIDEHEDSPDLTLVETSELVDKMRAVKDRDELEILSKAVEVTDRALESVAATVAPGVTEGEVAWELEKSMREQGAEGLAFETIVAAGPNGALPHHLADETPIQEGQAVVIDMGAKYDGYCADLTRTIVVGEPDEKFGEVYGTVLRAQIEAEERVRPGMTGKEVDAISRDIIADAGYGDNFGHSLGHGVGLAVHEYPRVGPTGDDAIEDGMVFTIEPGIYLSGWGGVRIEDIVVMEDGRARVLSRAPKLEAGG